MAWTLCTSDNVTEVNLDFYLGIQAWSYSSTNFSFGAIGGPALSAGITEIGGSYGSIAAAEAAVAAFVNELGYPWVQIGTVPAPVSEGAYLVAVNMAQVARMVDDAGVGVDFNGFPSAGYAPWADGPTAIAALLKLGGVVTDTV